MTVRQLLDILKDVPEDASVVIGVADTSDENDWIICDIGAATYDADEDLVVLEEQL